jgi:hypothetical protein
MVKRAKSANKVVASSGNVFADLGLPDAAELDTKVRLAVAVNPESALLRNYAAGGKQGGGMPSGPCSKSFQYAAW